MWIVRIALNRPYTFIVAALVIILMTPIVLQRTPTDIFPDIDIPVISIAWNYAGLSPQQMEDRIVANDERFPDHCRGQYQEAAMSSRRPQVAARSSRLLPNPSTDASTSRMTQVTAVSQTVLRQLPPGIAAPLIITYSASAVPILLQLNSPRARGMSEQELFDYAVTTVRNSTGDDPEVLQFLILTAERSGRFLSTWTSRLCRQKAFLPWMGLMRSPTQNLVLPSGTVKMGSTEFNGEMNGRPPIRLPR